jgi:hypothetical protein
VELIVREMQGDVVTQVGVELKPIEKNPLRHGCGPWPRFGSIASGAKTAILLASENYHGCKGAEPVD